MPFVFKFRELKRPPLNFSKYSKIFTENFLSLTLTIIPNFQNNIEILGIIWFCTFPGFVNAKFQ